MSVFKACFVSLFFDHLAFFIVGMSDKGHGGVITVLSSGMVTDLLEVLEGILRSWSPSVFCLRRQTPQAFVKDTRPAAFLACLYLLS